MPDMFFRMPFPVSMTPPWSVWSVVNLSYIKNLMVTKACLLWLIIRMQLGSVVMLTMLAVSFPVVCTPRMTLLIGSSAMDATNGSTWSVSI